jgi:hypothetical protein
MTDDTGLTGSPDDEIASAVLDGEATPDEVARVAREPQLAERVEAFRAVQAAVAEPVSPPSASARDHAVATAVAAAATQSAGSETASDTEGGSIAGGENRVRPLVRPKRAGRTWSIAAAVAAAVLIPLAAVAVLSSGESQDDSASSGGETAADQFEAADDEVVTSTAPSLDSAESQVAEDEPDLGAIDDADELREVASADLRSTRSAESATDVAPSAGESDAPAPSTTVPVTPSEGATSFGAETATPCTAAAQSADPSLDTLVYTAKATYQGTPVWVEVYRSADGASEIAVVNAIDGCTTLERVTL